MKNAFFLTTFTLSITTLSAQQTFKLEEIMKGDDFIGHSPENYEWSYDGSGIYFDWNPDNEPGNSPYYYRIADGKTEKLAYSVQNPPAAPAKHKAYETIYFSGFGDLPRYSQKTEKKEVVLSMQQGIGQVQR